MPREIVSVAVEGPTDTEIVSRIFAWLGIGLGTVYGQRGKDHLDGKLRAWNAAAKFAPWLVVRDLDHDEDCAPDLIKRLLPSPSPLVRFRVSVRAADAWLLADGERLASFLAVSKKSVPDDPDSLHDPKRTIVDLARGSKRREVRDDHAFADLPGVAFREPRFRGRVEARLRRRPVTVGRDEEAIRRYIPQPEVDRTEHYKTSKTSGFAKPRAFRGDALVVRPESPRALLTKGFFSCQMMISTLLPRPDCRRGRPGA